MSNITQETINTQLEKAYNASPYKEKFNLGVVQVHTMQWIQQNQQIVNAIKDKASFLAFIYEGMLEGQIIGRDYWVINYKGRPQFKKTQEGNKKWLSLNFDVIDFKADVILKGDSFSADAGTGEFSHTKTIENLNAKVSLDNIVGAYAQVVYKDRNTNKVITKFKVLGKDYLDRVSQASKTNMVWSKWPDKMCQAKASNELVKELQGLTQIYQSTGIGTINLDEAVGVVDGKPIFADSIERQPEPKVKTIEQTVDQDEKETMTGGLFDEYKEQRE